MNFFDFLLRKKNFLLGLLLACIVATLDLASKSYMFNILNEQALLQHVANVEIKVTNFFSLVKVWNSGVSFGMFHNLSNSKIIFSVVQLSIALVLLIWLYCDQQKYLTWCIGLIAGGAFGNAIDRIKNGAVADFLDFHIHDYHWPAFNLADSCVCVGVAIIVFHDLFKR